MILGYAETSRLLVAWCELRQGFRHFRADRIVEFEVLNEPNGLRRANCDAAGSDGARRTSAILRETDLIANDPNRTWEDQERRIVTLNRPFQCIGCSSELCLIMAAARTAIPCCTRARTFPEEPCILQGIRDEMAVSPSEALPALRRMIRGRQAR